MQSQTWHLAAESPAVELYHRWVKTLSSKTYFQQQVRAMQSQTWQYNSFLAPLRESGRLTRVQWLFTCSPSPLQPSKFSFEYLPLPAGCCFTQACGRSCNTASATSYSLVTSSHAALLHFSLQSSHLNICHYQQDAASLRLAEEAAIPPLPPPTHW